VTYLGKLIKHGDKLIQVKVTSNDYKYSIINKNLRLKLKKKVEKVKKSMKEGK
jgi:hypothetical protein